MHSINWNGNLKGSRERLLPYKSASVTTVYHKREWIFKEHLIYLLLRAISARWDKKQVYGRLDQLHSHMTIHLEYRDFRICCSLYKIRAFFHIELKTRILSLESMIHCDCDTKPTIKQVDTTALETPQVFGSITCILECVNLYLWNIQRTPLTRLYWQRTQSHFHSLFPMFFNHLER